MTDRSAPIASSSSAGLLHDVGHGLLTISLLAVTVGDDPALPASLRDRMILLEREIDRVRELVGGGERVPRVGSLRALLAEVVEPLRITAPAAVVLAPGPDVPLPADPGLLWRLVVNLVDNAVRAAGRVVVEVVGTSPPTVEIRDDGPGPGRGPAGASGQGLAIVRTLAEQCDAEVTLAGAPGGGTTARLVFGGGAAGRGDGGSAGLDERGAAGRDERVAAGPGRRAAAEPARVRR